MNPKHYLALDLGAESGRAILGTIDKGKLSLSEEHRFLTGAESMPAMYPDLVPDGMDGDSGLVWDFIRFWHEIKKAIRSANRKAKLQAVGVDTWGVDFALLDKFGMLISFPFSYRDSRSNGMMEEAYKRLPKSSIYACTGIQFMPLNSLYHLLSMQVRKSPLLQAADKFLMVPDLINYWLCGKAVAEFTDATTSQIFDTRQRVWSEEIIKAMGFSRHLFPQVIPPGTILGKLRPSVAAETAADAMVIAPATHDTGSAVCAVPADTEDHIWISSGTWSLVGMNVSEPIITPASLEYNFSNEGGINFTYRFLKNVTGLWVVQQCGQQWIDEGREFSYGELTEMAKNAPQLEAFVDPDYSGFLRPGKMADKVKEYCLATNQKAPQNEGEVIRAVLQGIALRYRFVIEKIEEVTNKKATRIHIVGGGTKNRLLSQFTADCLNRLVITGPEEATAIGNLMVQMIANGDVHDSKDGVSIIRDSFEILEFNPGNQQPWNQAYEKFLHHQELINHAF